MTATADTLQEYHVTPQGNIELMLSDSIQRYENILHLFEEIAGKPDNNPDLLGRMGAEILQLQDEAAQADQQLLTLLHPHSEETAVRELLKKRQDTLQSILRHNQTLQATLQGIKSYLTHEIKEIQGGRKALSGYHRQTTSSTNGGIINGSL